MDAKLLVTHSFLTSLNLPTDPKTVGKFLPIWWKNPRLQGERSFALTEEGYRVATEEANLQFYKVDMPSQIKFTNQLIIWLDRYIDCPYYIFRRSVYVSREKVAVQLVLFGGDLEKFGRAKAAQNK